jgi:Protein of unknown function (DUF2510)
MVAVAQSVSDFITRLEHDFHVSGVGLTAIFCAVLAALVVLLTMANRHSRKKALRVAHAGRYAVNDPLARSFHLHRPAKPDPIPDPVTHGPARDASNPRYRPDVNFPSVPDPSMPTLEDVRATALATTDPALETLARFDPFDQPPAPKPEFGVEWDPSVGIAVAPIAGWYRDPDSADGGLRYWDGNAWTHRRPA